MVLQIYTNENNPGALKLLIGLKYAGREAKINFIDYTDKSLPQPKHLPYVQLQEDRIMFSTNAVLQYFFPPCKDDEALAFRWLEFEAYELAPVLSVAVGSSARSPKIKTMLLNSLGVLNENLRDTPFNKKAVSAPDIAIWSVLYPLYSDNALLKEYLESYPNLCQWMKLIGKEKNITESIKELKLCSGASAYQALLAGTKYPAGIFTAGLDSQTSPTVALSEGVTIEELEAAKIAWSKTYKDLPEPRKEVYPVLPVPGEKNVLITSALPYVNNVPHLGNIIGCVLSSDVFARFSRLCNWNTLLIGGTDEYGTATETKALEEGLTPQQICDKYFDIHNSIYRWFNIGFDYFGRTTTPEQTNLVQGMFLTLNENGFMATQPVDQLLCEKCNRYLADRFVEGGCPQPGCNYEDARGDQCDGCGKLVNATELKNPRCKVCRSTPVLRTSHQFFLDLPKLEPLLLHWIEKSVQGWTNNAKVITKSWMKEGLKPRCITRDLKWGVPVPLDGYRDKVFYVWFDAPLGYVSMTEKYTKEWRKWWQPEKNTDVTLYQFMAKDNVPFHSVMFPACLLGANAGWTLVSHIMATEYLNYEDGKFSKSRGVGVFGTDAQSTTIPSDVWRFYLSYVRPEGQDSCFSWVDLATKNNSELLNNLGNFVNRALMFSEKYFNSQIPEMNPNDEDYKVLALCTRELKTYITSLEKGKLRDGIRCLLAISKHGNQYMQSTQPWVLVKGTDEDKERAGTVIGICCTLASLLSTLMFPYMPETSRILRKQLNAPERTNILTADAPQIVNLLPPGHKIGKPAPLFSKIDAAYIEEMKKKFGGTQQASETVKANSNLDVGFLEKAVQNQADKVRSLKSSGAEKSIWQPEVALLLDLKKKLEAAQKNPKVENKVEPNSNMDVASLEKAVQNQADKVRSLKSSGAEKSIWQPEVAVLLDLKKKLEAAQKNPKVENKVEPNSNMDVASLEKVVQNQAEKVRSLKASGVEKSVWQPEVAVLLDLKKKLEAAQKNPKVDNKVESAPNGLATEEELKKVEMEIEKQGIAVRTLKESGAAKSEWEPQVKVLLQLKEKYATLSGKPLPAPSKSKKNKK